MHLAISQDAALSLLRAVVAVGVFYLLLWSAIWMLSRILIRRGGAFVTRTAGHLREPVLWVLFSLGLSLLAPRSGLPEAAMDTAVHFIAIGLITAVMFLLIRMSGVLNDFVVDRYSVSVADNLRARKIHTQLKVLRRIVVAVVCFVGFASILMTFERVRQLGASLMASAGLIGIIVGVAAQRTIHTFLTGMQIALTQPIRLDDVVIVEGQWGRIEEITLTYVVVRIWDQRRLIVPVTNFIEKPFENWTRVNADILGTVFVYVDYTVPVDAVREKLLQIAETSENWDRKVCVLQVTNTTDRSVELRALVSAADASKAWELRCLVREQLIGFIRDKYPGAFPKVRGELAQNRPSIP